MKLTNSCYAVLGLGYSLPWTVNSGFIIGKEKTLIVDSGPNYLAAQTIYGYAKNLKLENELIVVNTEKHFDHICGNSFFKESGCKIYGHRNNFRNEKEFVNELKYFNENIDNKVRRSLGEEKIFFKNTKIANPDFVIEDGHEFQLGGIEAKVVFTPGHTDSNISIYIEKEKVLYCGDLIVNDYLPSIEEETKENLEVWIKSLDEISKLEIEVVILGHGFLIRSSEIRNEISRIKNILNTFY